MERSIYTREEIEAFVDEHLKILGMPGTDVDPNWVHKRYMRAIEALPPWQQTLLIESRGVSVVGDSKSINFLYEKSGGKKAVNGFFQPGDLSVAFNEKDRLDGRNMIFWHVAARGDAGMHTQSHEEGHRIDMMLGADADRPYEYFSTQNPVLRQALADELKHRERLRTQLALPALPAEGVTERGLLAWLNKCLARPFRSASVNVGMQVEGIPIGDTLYDDYREIEDHLALYEDRSSDETEAFAEMTGHHTALYARYQGNRAAVDYALTTHYPYYWPAYRDIAIPEMERRAEELLEQRRERIDEYVTAAWALADTRGQEFDETSVRRAAAIAVAKGTSTQEAREMRDLCALYDRPIEPAMRVFKDIAEMNWYALTPATEQRKVPHTFDYAEVQSQMEDHLDAVGIDSFVDCIKQMRREAKELASFADTEERFARYIGLPEIAPGSPHARAVMNRFNTLIAQGGPDAVKAYREALPTRSMVDAYIFARTSWQEMRDTLIKDDAVIAVPVEILTNETLENELRMLAEAGGREAIVQATASMREEAQVLSNYYSRLNWLAEAIGGVTGEKATYFSGTDILSQFDALKDRGGLQEVQKEIMRLKVPGDTIAAYATAREDSESARVSIKKHGGDISWGRKDGLYRPFSVAVNEMSHGFMGQLARDMRALVMQGGAEALVAETQRLRQETHIVVAHAIGKPTVQGSGMG